MTIHIMYRHLSICVPAILALLFTPASTTSSKLDSSQRQQILGGGEDDGKGNKSPLDEDFEKLVNDQLELWHVPALSIAVVDGDGVWAEGYGIANLGSSTPAGASTLFLVGSTTKAFVGAAMSLIVDDNDKYPELQWTTPISNILRDDFVLEDTYSSNRVTIEDALSHRTGMPRHDDSYGGLYSGHPMTARDAVRSLRHLPLTAQLRTKWQYCNIMYIVIGYLIETVTGTRLESFISTRILQPLGMNATYFSTEAAHKAPEHFATGYVYSNNSYHTVPDFNLTSLGGPGFMVSNVLDYTLWLRAMISQSPPISKAGHQALRTPRTLMDSVEPYTGPIAYTLGWMTGTYKGYEWFQHSGGMEGYGANVIFFPELKWGSVAFANTAGSSNALEEKVMWYLIDEKLEVKEEKRYDWNKGNLDAVKNRSDSLLTAKSHFYPNIPAPPLPLSIAPSGYAGTYYHPAYHNMTIQLASCSSSLSQEPSGGDEDSSPLFTIDRSNQTWGMKMNLQHVSGDYFIAYVDSTTAPGTLLFRHALPAQFVIGADGNPARFGARMEETMGEELIWFDRIL